MSAVLYVGQDPDTVDFADPALPPGTDAAKIAAGIAAAVAELSAHGWEAEPCMIAPDDAGIAMLRTTLASRRWDCVVVGAGLRMPAKTVPLFERVIDAIRTAAPDARIAFNTSPKDTADAAARWLG